jgi:hypothetical protein
MISTMKRYVALIIAVAVFATGCVASVTTGVTATPSGTTAADAATQAPARTTADSTAAMTSLTTGISSGATKATTAAKPAVTAPSDTIEYVMTRKRDLLILMLAYPAKVSGVEMKEGKVFLVMASGSRILYDDRRAKSLDEKYANADIQDMLEVIYPLGTVDTLMSADFDPGRSRCYTFFNELYGSTKAAIAKNLVTVAWGKQQLAFNKQAGASAALLAISGQAAALAAAQPPVAGCIYPSSGTFNYRVIAGTDRLSPHAYAMAIDLNSADGGYWRWMSPSDGAKLLKKFPQNVVQVFERNNFIWGGKWSHFDLFHFEYRPELILKARCFPAALDPAQPWYQGVDPGDETVRCCISEIEESLG